jgi:hypothetical protein
MRDLRLILTSLAFLIVIAVALVPWAEAERLVSRDPRRVIAAIAVCAGVVLVLWAGPLDGWMKRSTKWRIVAAATFVLACIITQVIHETIDPDSAELFFTTFGLFVPLALLLEAQRIQEGRFPFDEKGASHETTGHRTGACQR